MKKNIRLETERLIIRQYEEIDLPDYHKLMSDRKNMYFLDDIITSTLEESTESLKKAIEANKQNKARRFCIALKGTNNLIGAVGYEIREVTPLGKIADPMGWFIMPEYQNNGYITEAAKKVLEFAFLHDNCVRVVTGCYKDNIPTQKVMAKIGFRKEAEKPKSQYHDGIMKDRLEYAINKNEYGKAVESDNVLKYTAAELEEARFALTSTLRKCEKIDDGKKLGRSQQTLLDRRIKALRLALELIEREIVN